MNKIVYRKPTNHLKPIDKTHTRIKILLKKISLKKHHKTDDVVDDDDLILHKKIQDKKENVKNRPI